MDIVETSITTLVGAAVGLASALYAGGRERRATEADALQRALAVYLGDLTVVVSRLRDLPDSGSLGVLARTVDRIRGERATWAANQRSLMKHLGPGWQQPIEQLVRSTSQLRIISRGDELPAAMERAMTFVEELSESRSAEIVGRWPTILQDVKDAGAAEISMLIDEGRRRGQRLRLRT